MHASGTSALARLVNLLGIPLGSDVSEVHWESAGLTLFQDRLLQELGGSWDAPPTLTPGWHRQPRFRPAVRQARELFERTHRGLPVWVWKDPRTCLTLPLWRYGLKVRMLTLIVYRHPLELCLAMRARDGFDTPRALALWERYSGDALANTAGLPRLLISYEQMVSDPLLVAQAVRRFLAHCQVETPELPAKEVTAFIDPELRHARYDGGSTGLEQQLTPSQRLLLHALHRLSDASLVEAEAGPVPAERRLTSLRARAAAALAAIVP